MKKLIWGLVVVVAVGVGLYFLLRKPAPAAEGGGDAEVKAVASVQVAPLQNQSITRALTAYGVVEASSAGAQAITLGYDVVVKAIYAPVGSRVAAGEPVMDVDPTPDARLQMDSARASAALAEKSLAAVRQRLELRLATGDDVRVAEQAANDARLKVVSYVQRGMAQSRKITAPSAAIVTKLDPQAGTVVAAGTTLVILGEAGHLQARLGVEPSDTAQLKPGQPVIITAVGRPDADPASATIGTVGGVADPATGAVDVRVPLPDGGTWVAGEHVQGAIELEKKTTLVAPRAAVLPDDDQQILYTVKDHKAVKHLVQVGITSGDSVEVIGKDLTAGDTVVTQGNYELSDGMSVLLPGEGGQDKADDKSDKAGDQADKADDKAKGDAK